MILGRLKPPLLYITYSEVKWINHSDIVRARIDKRPCPMGLLPDSEDALKELLDRLRYSGVIIVERIQKPRIDPVRMGLGHNGLLGHYSRPVLVWIGVLDDNYAVRAGRLDSIFGYKAYACQAGALLINQLLEAIGARIRIT